MPSCLCARVRVNDPPSARIRVREDGPVEVGVDQHSPVVPSVDEYGGPYEVTPTEAAQTLATANLLMARDLTIAPIPGNYGLITYNGTSIRVS